MEYKRPTGKYFVHYFHKICSICISFQDALAVKISLDLLKGLWSYGVLIWRGLVTPKFSVPLAAKLCVRHPNILEVQERARGPLSPCQVWWRSDFTRRRDGKKRWVFLSVCHAFSLSVTLFSSVTLILSVTLLNVIDCAPDFTMKTLEYRNDFDVVANFPSIEPRRQPRTYF